MDGTVMIHIGTVQSHWLDSHLIINVVVGGVIMGVRVLFQQNPV